MKAGKSGSAHIALLDSYYGRSGISGTMETNYAPNSTSQNASNTDSRSGMLYGDTLDFIAIFNEINQLCATGG
jgi:hypothetical protein